MAIYQARFLKYLHARGLADTATAARLGVPRRRRDGRARVAGRDLAGQPGEAGQPHLRGELQPAAPRRPGARQREDHPGAGGELPRRRLERDQGRSGGRGWDPLLAADKTGLLLKRMEECVDGEYQDFKSKNGAYVREHFFGKYPELLDLVSDMTDDQIWALSRGGHDPSKVYAAYKAAVDNVGTPTVILAKTVKGYGMGEAGEGQNITHQQKKMGENVLRAFRDRFGIVDLPDEKIPELPFLSLKEGSPEQAYLRERRAALGGALPVRAAAVHRDPARPRAVGLRRASSSPPASARSPRRWRSSGSSPRCCATSRSASGWSRSCPTSRARSAWRGCSASSASGARSGSSTGPRTRTSSCTTRRTSPARCCRRASTRPAPCRPGSRPPPATR